MPNATQEEIEEAAKKANAHNFILAFPDGYNTQVGSASSSQIIGGQKQRVAISRSRYTVVNVCFLKEESSGLTSCC